MTDQIGCLLWRKPNGATTWLIVQMWSMQKMKLSCHDRSNQVRSMTKSWQDNDVTDHIGLLYVETKTQLSWPIWLSVVCDVNQTGHRCDQLYKCDLHKKQNFVMMLGLSAICDENQIGQRHDWLYKCSLSIKQYLTFVIDYIECQL